MRKNTNTKAKLVLCVAFCCPIVLFLLFIKIKPRHFSFQYGDSIYSRNETNTSEEERQTEVPVCKPNENLHRKPLFELNYTYVIDGRHTCEPADDVTSLPSIVIIVHSRISSSDQRDAIRNTWGVASRRYDDDQPMVKIVFILGRDLNSSSTTTTRIEQENRLYRDVIVADFKDTYRNLTLKSLYGMHWARAFCRSAEYIVKVDDDVYLDVDLLKGVLLNSTDEGGIILGSLNARARVQRRGLWKVKTNIYPSNFFPPYCSGNAYAMTSSVTDCLLAGVSQVPYFPLEDVYVTGMLARARGITCRGLTIFPQWYVGPTGKHVRMLLEGKLVALHNVHYTQMRGIFDKLIERNLKRQPSNG